MLFVKYSMDTFIYLIGITRGNTQIFPQPAGTQKFFMRESLLIPFVTPPRRRVVKVFWSRIRETQSTPTGRREGKLERQRKRGRNKGKGKERQRYRRHFLQPKDKSPSRRKLISISTKNNDANEKSRVCSRETRQLVST